MTTDKRGVSALMLQRQLGLKCYETAWMMLHKLRRAMVSAVREPLHGEVEVDDTWVGGEQAGLRGSWQLKNRRAALVLVAGLPTANSTQVHLVNAAESGQARPPYSIARSATRELQGNSMVRKPRPIARQEQGARVNLTIPLGP